MSDISKLVEAVNAFSINTSRLRLKRFSKQNIDEEVAQDTSPEIMRYIRDILPSEKALERAESIAEPWKGEDHEWAGLVIYLKGEKKMMGALSFRYQSMVDDTLEIGFRLHPDYHGKGYVSEAARALFEFLFTTAKAHKVVAYCVVENIASWKVMEKLGMQREGCLREYSKLSGRWHDELVYGVLESDYYKK